MNRNDLSFLRFFFHSVAQRVASHEVDTKFFLSILNVVGGAGVISHHGYRI